MTILVGDVGGTNARFAVVSAHDGALELIAEETLPSGKFPGLEDALAVFIERCPAARAVERACFGLAGPIRGDRCETTNLPWVVEGAELARTLGLDGLGAHGGAGAVELLNDVEAAAWGLVVIGPNGVRPLAEGRPRAGGNRALVAPGTGLGAAVLFRQGGRYHPFATEGGHTDFAPRSPLEIELLGFLRESLQLTRVSVERVVSGQGIASIYELLRLRGTARESAALAAAFETWKREIGKESPTVDLAAVVSQAAIAEDEPLCTETMDVFVGAYGAEAGNLALKLLPYGGLYVAGGIAPKILPLLERDGFIAAFKDKGRMAPLLERVPVHVVLDSKVGLLGAARHAAELL